jgi:hypothetical protein
MLSANEVLRRGLENEPDPRGEELPEEVLAELAAEAAAQEQVEEF